MRSLLFTIWVLSDKSVATTVKMLTKLLEGQYQTIEQGGAKIINASMAGKNFTYALPQNWESWQFLELLRMAYKTIHTGGADGMMTEQELSDYVLDTRNHVTDTITARINYHNTRG